MDLAIPYRKKAEKLQSELQKLQKLFKGIFDNHNKAIGKYLDFVNDPDCQVAIVGAVNSGKSTLMNAILGVDIASTDVRPETAALTIFKYSSKGNYVEVHFYTTEEWNDLWASAAKSKDSLFRKEYDELGAGKKKKDWINHPLKKETSKSIGDLRATVKEYSSSQSPCHYFVKKIVIGLSTWGSKNFPLPPYLTFVDTPGLFDVIPYRANITREYIDRANAVVVCVDKTIRDADYKTIVETFENIGNDKGKVIILGTQMDVLNEPDEDWKKLKEKWHKQFEDLYRDRELVDTNIIGVSAYIFNMVQKLDAGEPVKDNAININTIITFAEKSGIRIRPFNPIGRAIKIFADEKNEIIKKKEKILRQTNIGEFLQVLKEGPLKEPDMVLAEDIDSRFNDIVADLKQTAEDQKDKVERKLKYLHADQKKKKGVIAEKNREINKIKEEREDIQQKFDDMQKGIMGEITRMKKKINSELKKSMGA